MTTLPEGMTPTQFITALNNNNADLVTNWGVNADSFGTVTAGMTSAQITAALNYNLRLKSLGIGVHGIGGILNNGYSANVKRFNDNIIHNILSPEALYGESTCLVSDDGNQIDLWAFVTNRIYYSYSTGGLVFSAPVATDIPTMYLRQHILKYSGTYYHYANHADNTIHLFTGTDKIHYTDIGEVLPLGTAGQWDDAQIANMFVWHEGANWYMLYEADRSTGGWKIGLATASDPAGPWTKYASNPVLTVPITYGCGNPELPRVNNEVIKYNGNYYCYFHVDSIGLINRAYSPDLINWTVEGKVLDIFPRHVGIVSYGDHSMTQFKGKSYLFWGPSNQVDAAHIDCGIDNRDLATMISLAP
jgi:hypothetical protein